MTRLTVDTLTDETNSELKRAVDGTPSVELADGSGTSLTISGDDAGVEQLERTLWTRELSARQHGQDSLADADQTARECLRAAR
ncbi:hypothetical protein [Haloarcula halophila]|uniref:hypothetical protein n=1 Tax=Haloarcula TaxID=2237 RepID=UPI0023E42555|nr:hypothetical protein [Halomicroarcula sp. DFY41]